VGSALRAAAQASPQGPAKAASRAITPRAGSGTDATNWPAGAESTEAQRPQASPAASAPPFSFRPCVRVLLAAASQAREAMPASSRRQRARQHPDASRIGPAVGAFVGSAGSPRRGRQLGCESRRSSPSWRTGADVGLRLKPHRHRRPSYGVTGATTIPWSRRGSASEHGPSIVAAFDLASAPQITDTKRGLGLSSRYERLPTAPERSQ